MTFAPSFTAKKRPQSEPQDMTGVPLELPSNAAPAQSTQHHGEGAAAAVDAAAGQPEPVEEKSTGGLHAILKGTDMHFKLEVYELEKLAKTEATDHARAGLPRMEAPANEELEVERLLRARGSEVLLQWADKVRRRVQDAIQAASVSAGTNLVQLRGACDQLQLTTDSIHQIESELREAQAATTGGQKTVEYGGLLNPYAYWLMFLALAVIDWIANIPIFAQLLPRDPGAQERLQSALADAGQHLYAGGLIMLLHRVLSAPDVSVLALGVVVFLMFLCHAVGKSLRRLVAFRRKDEPLAELGLRSHRRQSWVPFSISVTAIVIAVSFLFLSRGQLARVTDHRLGAATRSLHSREAQEAQAQAKGDPAEIAAASDAYDLALKTHDEAQKDSDYAQGIAAMNTPIGLLNIVLVLTAAIASYMHDKGSISEVSFGDPRLNALSTRLHGLRGEAVQQRTMLRELDARVQNALALAQYLGQARPLQEWPARARRLETIIPLFRAHNAQERGIDVRNIQAFAVERPLEFDDIRDDEPFHTPFELQRWLDEYELLRNEIDGLQATTAVAATQETV